MKTTLVIMAAGMASRYGDMKQIVGMGPNGEILLEYSIMDAIRAGFDKAVLIIQPKMKVHLSERLEAKYASKIELAYACQTFDSVPCAVRPDRVKPFGTVHAVLCAANEIDGPFAVLNADDYYGSDAFLRMRAFLDGGCDAAMVGYRLANTVSRYGSVTRGVCLEQADVLTGIQEVRAIRELEDGQIASLNDDGAPQQILRPDVLVSMNFWGFGKEILGEMDRRFRGALQDPAFDALKGEYLLPVFVGECIRDGQLRVHVLPTDAHWFGVTYQQDRAHVVEALRELHDRGCYPI